MNLGTFGIWTLDFEWLSAVQIRESIRDLEDQGWPTVWIPELAGREALTHAGYLLSCTDRIHVVNGIAQIWARDARWAYGAGVLLADAYPGRHVLGLGHGGVERPGSPPLAAMAAYLDDLDALAAANRLPKPAMHRILAAYGPRMLELARDRSSGAHTYHVTVAHTAQARGILGPSAFLGVEQPVLFETEAEKARAIARAHMKVYLRTPFNIAKFRRLGYSEEDLTNGGSDRFIDDFVIWGDLDGIVQRLQAHIDAGADHVALQVIGIEPGQTASRHWGTLGEALLM